MSYREYFISHEIFGSRKLNTISCSMACSSRFWPIAGGFEPYHSRLCFTLLVVRSPRHHRQQNTRNPPKPHWPPWFDNVLLRLKNDRRFPLRNLRFHLEGLSQDLIQHFFPQFFLVRRYAPEKNTNDVLGFVFFCYFFTDSTIGFITIWGNIFGTLLQASNKQIQVFRKTSTYFSIVWTVLHPLISNQKLTENGLTLKDVSFGPEIISEVIKGREDWKKSGLLGCPRNLVNGLQPILYFILGYNPLIY